MVCEYAACDIADHELLFSGLKDIFNLSGKVIKWFQRSVLGPLFS